MKGLFLDDERNPEDVTWIDYPENIEWVVVRDSSDFRDAFILGWFDVVSFDHDIAEMSTEGKETTGYDVLKSMVGHLMDNQDEYLPEQVFFHTQNLIGKENMESYWNNFCRHYKLGNEYETITTK